MTATPDAAETPPEPLLSNEDWYEFQRIPEQGYSHRGWIEHRFQKRLKAELDAAELQRLEILKYAEIPLREALEMVYGQIGPAMYEECDPTEVRARFVYHALHYVQRRLTGFEPRDREGYDRREDQLNWDKQRLTFEKDAAERTPSAAKVGAKAIRTILRVWQFKDWADAPRDRDPLVERLANAQYVTDWLRAKADELDPPEVQS